MQSIINRIEKFGVLAPQEDIASKKRLKKKKEAEKIVDNEQSQQTNNYMPDENLYDLNDNFIDDDGIEDD